jgi:hypothetical protein
MEGYGALLTVSDADSIAGSLSRLGYSLVPWPAPGGPRVRGVTAVPLRGPGTRFPVLACWRTRQEPDPLLDTVLAAAPCTKPRSLRETTR